MINNELQGQDKRSLTLDELAGFVGLQPEVVHSYFVYGLIDPHTESPELLFAEEVVVRILKIERLRSDLGVNLAGCGLVLDLLERIEELEHQLALFEELPE